MTTAGPGPPQAAAAAAVAAAPAAPDPAPLPPIHVIYSHLHDSIRAELDALAAAVVALQQKGAAIGSAAGGAAGGATGGVAVGGGGGAGASSGAAPGLRAELEALQERYSFLEQVYTYHSSVEDEVVYPALDAKVRNVTLAYSVEHEDEEHLFEQLLQLLGRALGEAECSREQAATVRLLACKVEEISTTLRKHLRKEEEQLLPLLLAHFTTGEQAELVAQFLCSIPLSTVEQVLGWLRRQMPAAEQAALREQLRRVVADRLLQQLLLAWLAPEGEAGAGALSDAGGAQAAGGGGGADPMAVDGASPRAQQGAAPPALGAQQGCAAEEFVCCRHAAGGTPPCRQGAAKGQAASPANGCSYDRELEDAGMAPGNKPPLREIFYFHQAIRSALHSFADEARALRAAEGRVTTAQLSALVERHRFIRAVCRFHSASEEEIVFPALARLRAAAAAGGGQQQAQQQQAGGGGGGSPLPGSLGSQGEGGALRSPSPQQQQGSPAKLARVHQDHDEETAKLEELGRLLGAVKAHARRGAKEVAALVAQLSDVADGLAKTMHRHMAREEADVLPVLMRSLCGAQQRHMVWRILRAMPLRLLERVMPWVAGRLREDDVREWLANIRSAAPRHEAPLVELLSQWARRGKLIMPAVNGSEAGRRRSLDDPSFYSNQTCGPASFLSTMAAVAEEDAGSGGAGGGSEDGAREQRGAAPALPGAQQAAAGSAAGSAASAAALQAGHLKRIRTDGGGGGGGGGTRLPVSPHGVLLPGLNRHFDSSFDSTPRMGGGGGGPGVGGGAGASIKPIDHIFQFHKALRRELREIEATAVAFQESTEEATAWEFDRAIQELEAKFQFLRGIYRAHSKAEDEIVFPALEAKETLRHISHAYTLDHQEEEQYFEDLAAVLVQIRGARQLAPLREHAAQLSRMCAAVRASLETHVRAEEQELWPLFAEHFSIAEQEALVGVIIGNTGAEVLTTMLSWVQGSMTLEEQEAMIASLKSASRSTAFEQWLSSVQGSTDGAGGSPPGPRSSTDGGAGGAAGAAAGPAAGGAAASAGAGAGAAAAAAAVPSHQEEVAATLAEVGEYLAQQGMAGQAPHADPGSLAADSSCFKPGWEDIFRMNQKQLEAAIRRVSNDPSLEPQRKAYLRQNIMASHYIVTQQRRMHRGGSSTGATPTALAAAGMRDGLKLAGTPQALAGGGGGVIAAAVAAAQQEELEQQQQQQAGAPPVAAAAAQQQQQAGGEQRAPAIPRYHDAAAGVLGCRHYRRRCMLVAPCCDTPHVCRLCHDEASDHQVDRYAVSEMVCMECATRQPVAASCSACSASMARYYCGICHLFDDDQQRQIYHCPFCNFCRQGRGLGVDSFHCMACNACMSLELFNKHRCVEQSLGGTCPVCSDRLFESQHPVKESPCGHFMHSHCFAAYTRYAYTCPVCFKSLGDMSVYWKMIDSLLSAERLPPEYASRRQPILCNDCGQSGEAPFHFVYHKCPACTSYNTRVL